jgi:hypothetical protein
MKKLSNWSLRLLTVMLLSSCGPTAGKPASDVSSVRAWFDAPLPGTVYTPPNPCQIVAHGASPVGVAVFELSIKGQVQPSIPSPDAKASLATLTRDCGISDPGVYPLRLRVQDNAGQWSAYAETSVTILGGPTASPEVPVPQIPTTPTSTPTPAPAAAAGSVSIKSTSSDVVYAGDKSCGPLQETIVAQATAPKSIQVVVLFYRFEPGSPSGFDSVAMAPIGGDLYQVSLNPTSLLGGPADATLQYQVVVQQTDGDTSIRTPVMADISVQACGEAAPVDCSSYKKKNACESHGCAWVAVPAIVPVFECRNP